MKTTNRIKVDFRESPSIEIHPRNVTPATLDLHTSHWKKWKTLIGWGWLPLQMR